MCVVASHEHFRREEEKRKRKEKRRNTTSSLQTCAHVKLLGSALASKLLSIPRRSVSTLSLAATLDVPTRAKGVSDAHHILESDHVCSCNAGTSCNMREAVRPDCCMHVRSALPAKRSLDPAGLKGLGSSRSASTSGHCILIQNSYSSGTRVRLYEQQWVIALHQHS